MNEQRPEQEEEDEEEEKERMYQSCGQAITAHLSTPSYAFILPSPICPDHHCFQHAVIDSSMFACRSSEGRIELMKLKRFSSLSSFSPFLPFFLFSFSCKRGEAKFEALSIVLWFCCVFVVLSDCLFLLSMVLNFVLLVYLFWID